MDRNCRYVMIILLIIRKIDLNACYISLFEMFEVENYNCFQSNNFHGAQFVASKGLFSQLIVSGLTD